MGSDRRQGIEGEWFPALSGQSFPATFQVHQDNFTITGADGSVLSSGVLGELKISPRIGSITRTVSLSDASQFMTSDNDAVDAIANKRPDKLSSAIHSLERFHPRLFGLVALVLILGLAIYRFALPVLVEVAVLVTPPVATDLMAKGALQTLDTTVFSPSDLSLERQAAINNAFVETAGYSKSGAKRFNLNFRRGGLIGPNAFALPDGTIVVTDELVSLMNGNDELILGVLAHEMGHVEYDHSLRQLYRAAGVAGLVMLIGGDIGEGAQDLLIQGAGLLTLSHSRDAESEADRHSVEVMLKSGGNPLAIAEFFEVLEKELGIEADTSMLSTHPGMKDRRTAAEAYAKSLLSGKR